MAWAICREMREVLIHIILGDRESYNAWPDFLWDMIWRGLQLAIMIAVDGAPGLMQAVEDIWADNLLQQSFARKVLNVIDKTPDSAPEEVNALGKSVYYAHPTGR
jgi:putative transposase